MNPSYWIPIGIGCSLCYLFYVLSIDFRLARLDDDVAQPESDVHNDLNIWSYEFYLPRVRARKSRAFLRWVGVSAVTMLICFLVSGGGRNVVKALAAPTPTPSPTLTGTATASPTASRTPTITPTGLITATGYPTMTQGVYQPTSNIQHIQVTRIVQVQVTRLVQVQVTRLVTVIRLVTLTPGPTQTPWIIYPTQELTATPEPILPSETPTETPSPTATETATETATPTPTVSPTPTIQETP